MSTNTYEFTPDYCVHPGEILEEIIESRGISKGDLAKRTGLTPKTISQIINGKGPVTSETALALERALGMSAETWSNLDSQYRLFQARREEEEQIQKLTEWADQFPLKELKKRGVVSDLQDRQATAKELLSFFGLNSIETFNDLYLKPAVSFRRSVKQQISNESIAAWLRLVEMRGMEFDTVAYNPAVFKQKLQKIRSFTLLQPKEALERLPKECAEAGVAFVVEPVLPKTGLYGATRWLNRSKAILAVTLRYRYEGQFWFSFFHEAGHIVLHGRDRTVIDGGDSGEDTLEREADGFAGEILFPKKEWNEFLKRGKFYEGDINSFAKKIGLAPGIVVGILQHDNLIKKDWHNGLKRKFEIGRDGK